MVDKRAAAAAASQQARNSLTSDRQLNRLCVCWRQSCSMRQLCLHGIGLLATCALAVILKPSSTKEFSRLGLYIDGLSVAILVTSALTTWSLNLQRMRGQRTPLCLVTAAALTLVCSVHCAIVICCELAQSWSRAVAYVVAVHVMAAEFGFFGVRLGMWCEG